MGNGRPPVWILIRAHLRGDPKKTAVLVLLAVVMVVVYARLFITTGGPQEVSAADQAVAAVPPVAASASASENGPAEARVKLDRPLTRSLSRNPFTLSADRLSNASGADGGLTVESLGLDPVERARAAAAELVLESTIVGSAPLASISGRIVRPGDEIDGFVLERVEPTKVVLRQNEIRVILPLR